MITLNLCRKFKRVHLKGRFATKTLLFTLISTIFINFSKDMPLVYFEY